MERKAEFNIIQQAFCLTERVADFLEHAQRFFYEVMLSVQACPACGGNLAMLGEGQCRCLTCRKQFDPTVAFQHCAACGGTIALRVRRYVCQTCGVDVSSRFLFDGLVFDVAYFADKMRDFRQRREEQRETVRNLLAESRSSALVAEAADLGSVPGLVEALNGLTLDLGVWQRFVPKEGFDLNRYQSHIQAHLGADPARLEEIPPLSENRRYDRIGRFIAAIFLDQARMVDLWQEGQTIWVMKHVDREGQDLFGKVASDDGCEGSVG
jgi:hypothetical protein